MPWRQKHKKHKFNWKIIHLKLQSILDSVSVSPQICKLVLISGLRDSSKGSDSCSHGARLTLAFGPVQVLHLKVHDRTPLHPWAGCLSPTARGFPVALAGPHLVPKHMQPRSTGELLTPGGKWEESPWGSHGWGLERESSFMSLGWTGTGGPVSLYPPSCFPGIVLGNIVVIASGSVFSRNMGKDKEYYDQSWP